MSQKELNKFIQVQQEEINMPKFSKNSLLRLSTCDIRLVHLCEEVIKDYDFTVLCGYRNEEDQNKAFKEGKSKAKWGQSKHNTYLSKAVDLAPYPIDWNDVERFKELGTRMKKVAADKNIKIKWGGDWKMRDYPHFELVD